MHLKTRTWIGLGLAVAVALVLVWQFAGPRRANDAPTAVAKRDAGFPLRLTNLSAQAAAANVAKVAAVPGTSFAVIATNPPNMPFTNALAYRVSNTLEPLNDFLRSDAAVVLRNALIDTRFASPAIPEHLRASGDPGAYIIQARGLVTDEFRALLRQAGAEVVSYVPNNAFLVRASAGVARAVGNSPLTQSVLPFEPYYKLEPRLLALAVRKELSPYAVLNVVTFPGQTERAMEAMDKLNISVTGEAERTVFGDVLPVKAGAEQLAALAGIPAVQNVGIHFPKRPANDLSRVLVKVSTNELPTAPPHYPPTSHYRTPTNHLTGQGVTVAVADTGVDASHPDLAGRIEPGSYAGPVPGLLDPDGHGTHVIGTLLGNGSQSPLDGPTNAMGSLTNAVFSGVAPNARGLMQDLYAPDTVLQQQAAIRGIRISNNSWGRPGANDYDIFAASYDSAVRDSLPAVTGEQEMAYVFAAGNDGGGNANGFGGIPGSIVSPATAKNVITVGASDLPRFISNAVTRACQDVEVIEGGITNTIRICETNSPWWGMTDTNNQVSPYSSRGNVGIGLEGLYGRFKPDVVAPGSMTVSLRSRDYLEPDGSTNTIPFTYNNISVAFDRTNLYAVSIPPNAVKLEIFVATNGLSPTNLTISIGAEFDQPPAGFIDTNYVVLDPSSNPALQAGTLYYMLGNSNHAPNATFDLVLLLTVTNDVGTYYDVLRDMNAPLRKGQHGYRYESGTSMAAPVVSGIMALVQEFLGTNGTPPSPALLKAMVINGARSLSPNYSLHNQPAVNHQGWGLVNMSNTVPSGFSRAGTNGPMRLFDQTLTNSLATGGTEAFQINVPPEARSYPLRVTLVWTDPPGNPVTGVKLVNDMNLMVLGTATNAVGTGTNAVVNQSSLMWLGNHFPANSDFTDSLVISSTDTNVTATSNLTQVVERTRDFINNVENVYIRPPLSDTYTVVVKAHRVNVNAVNSHLTGHVQDYALVISSGNVVPTNNVNLIVSGPVFTNDPTARLGALVAAPRNTNNPTASARASLLDQRVGANNPLIVSTNGGTNQWAFFTYTNVNDATFTNVVFVTFLPPNLSRSRYREADIDLYVARGAGGPSLFALDPAAIQSATKSVGRGGTEVLYFNNATSGEVFYIGVKAEDQQAANFALYGESRNSPFSSQDESNNIVASAAGPFFIPDGTPDQPGGTNAMVFIVDPQHLQSTIQRVWVTNSIYHEEAGDLVGVLSRPGTSTNYVTLNNHRTWMGWENPDPTFNYAVVYDDSDQGDLGDETSNPPVFQPDGPGRLLDFLGEQAGPFWDFTVTDNALFHTGFVNDITVVIEPSVTNGSDANVLLDQRICVRAGTWLYRAVNIPSDAYNLEICVSEFERAITVPLEVYVRWGGFPDAGIYDHRFETLPPGECFNIGLGDNPPLMTGRYIIGFFNRDSQDVCLRVRATISRKSIPGPYLRYTSTDTPFQLLDNATTNSSIFVSEYGRISDLRVGLRVNHERASDLAFHLTSPTGTRLLLFENRGRTNTAGIGVNFTNVFTNVGRTVLYSGWDEQPVVHGLPSGGFASGWRVDSGNIDVVGSAYTGCGPFGGCGGCSGGICQAHSLTNAVDLNGSTAGSISTNIATLSNKMYRVSFAYSKNPNGNPSVNVGRLDAGSSSFTFSYGLANSLANQLWLETNYLFRASSNVTRIAFTGVSPSGSQGIFIDTVRIQEVDIVTNRFIYTTFTENTNLTTTPIKFGTPPYTNGAYGFITTSRQVIYTNDFANSVGSEWSLTTRTTSPLGSNFLGQFGNTSVSFNANPTNQPPHSFLEITFDLYVIDSWDGNPPWATAGPDIWDWNVFGTNVIHTTFANFSTNIPPFYNLRQSYPGQYPAGDFDGMTGAIAIDSLGYGRDVVYRITRRFAHSGGPIQMQFSASGLQALNDESWGIANLQIVALDGFMDDGNGYYLPEEPITPFFGQQAHGLWNLEVWDSRAGAAATNALVSWKLEFAFPQTNPPVVLLTNGLPYTNRVVGSGPFLFAVDVPCDEGFVTNTLTCLTPGTAGLNLVFNQFVLPTNGPFDVMLLTNVVFPTPRSAVLTNGQLPLISPSRYYLAVYNVNPAQSNEFTLTVNFQCGPPPIRLANDWAYCTTNAPGEIKRFDYVSSNNAVALQIETFNADGNVDLYARQVVYPHPAPGQYHFASTNGGTTNEIVVVTTNSSPPLVPVIWHIGVTNLSPGSAQYCVRVREIYDTNAVTVTVGTSVPTNAPPNSTTYFRVNVETQFCEIAFGVGNHPDGNLNIFAFFEGPQPEYIAGSVAPGLPPTIGPVPIAGRYGTWVVGVQNTNGVTVGYNFESGGVLCTPGPLSIQVTHSGYSTNGFRLEWDAAPGDRFQVEYSDTLLPGSWIAFPTIVTSGTGHFVFMDADVTSVDHRFYRIVRLP